MTARIFSIFTKWSFGNFFQYAMNVLERSGFLLFLLITQSVMVRFGRLGQLLSRPASGAYAHPVGNRAGVRRRAVDFHSGMGFFRSLGVYGGAGSNGPFGHEAVQTQGHRNEQKKALRYELGERSRVRDEDPRYQKGPAFRGTRAPDFDSRA